MSTDLVPAGGDSPYAVLRMETADIQELLRENLGGDTLNPNDLDRVKVPAGAGTRWEIPTISGTEAVQTIEGVIVHRASRRAYWPEKFSGANDPPQCFSDDGINGVGTPGGSCADCPLNQFGTAGDGKACKETRQLFVLTADSLIPVVVTIPPASLANVKAYFLRLLRNQLTPLDVVTNISLEKAQSKGGIDYSRVVLTAGGRLDLDATARLKAYAAELEPAFQAAARIERDEVEAQAA